MDTIFLKLLNMSITAGWLILAVLILRLLLKKAPKWVSCLLWGIVAVRLVCPFSLESGWSLIPSTETVVSSAVQDDAVRDNVVKNDVAQDNKVQNGAVKNDVSHDDEVKNAQGDLGTSIPVIHSGVTVIDRTVNSVLSESFAADSAESGTGSSLWHYWTQIASVIWLSIAGCILLYALIGFLRVKRKVRASIRLHDNVYVCDEIPSPFILGIIKPHVYLPSGMDGETEKYVIAHENTHLWRYDHWWKPFGYILLAVYWFHPLSWIAYILFCRDMELACDEKAVQTMEREDKASYAQALLDCSFPRRMVVACPLAFGEIGVKERVKAVLNYKRPAFWLILVALVACVAVAVCFLTDPKEADDYSTEKDDDYPVEIARSLFIVDSIGGKFYPASIDADAVYALDRFIYDGYWYTLELPDGYALSEYTRYITNGRGNLIEPQAYEYLGDAYYSVDAWTMSGFIEKIPDAQIFFLFKDGQIDAVSELTGHGEQERIGPLDGLDMPAYLCSITMGLYSSSDYIRFEELGIEPEVEESSYWIIFFAREDLDEAFYLALDQNQFSQEEAIEIAKTVKFYLTDTADTEPVDEFVPDPPVTTVKSVDFVVGAPVVDKQVFNWTDSRYQEAIKAYRDVLMGQAELCFYRHSNYQDSITNINDLINYVEYELKRFAIIDLDNDSEPEVVLSFTDYGEESCILKYYKGHVYVYILGYREFSNLKMDGTFIWAGSGQESGISTLLFQGNTTETDDKVYAYTGTEKFLINGQSVTKEDEDKAFEYYWSKQDATWYEFSEENIKKYLPAIRQ